VGSVIVSTGFKLFPADLSRSTDTAATATSSQVADDRLLAPTRPYNTVLRPSDGKVPDRIAYVMCTGSRDQTVDNRSVRGSVACTRSAEPAHHGLCPRGRDGFTVDVRTMGKVRRVLRPGRRHGTNYIKGRIAEIRELENGT